MTAMTIYLTILTSALSQPADRPHACQTYLQAARDAAPTVVRPYWTPARARTEARKVVQQAECRTPGLLFVSNK